MPNRPEHIKIGLIAGGSVGALCNVVRQLDEMNRKPDQHFDWGSLLKSVAIGCAIGGFTAILPDILDPPSNPNHRAGAHSIAMLGLVGLGLHAVLNADGLDPDLKDALVAALSGYASHLVADGMTPKGLPLI